MVIEVPAALADSVDLVGLVWNRLSEHLQLGAMPEDESEFLAGMCLATSRLRRPIAVAVTGTHDLDEAAYEPLLKVVSAVSGVRLIVSCFDAGAIRRHGQG